MQQRCAIDYEVVEGDFWIRLADASGLSLKEILAANNATVDTPLFPGKTICLPDGATVPAPPTTAAPTPTPTTAPATAPRRHRPPTTAPPTTAAPATTVKPVVTYPTISAAAAAQIIRDVWPDDLEGRAIEIATRESTLIVDREELVLLRVVPDQLGTAQSVARRSRGHEPRSALRRGDERTRRVHPLPAIRRLGSVDLNPVGNSGLSP